MRKRVRPLSQQEKYESRRVWLHVTNALRKNDLNSASRHKNQIEKQQRSSEKHRREQNIEFKPKSFLKLKHSGPDMSGCRTRMSQLLNSPGNDIDIASQHDEYDWFHKNWSLWEYNLFFFLYLLFLFLLLLLSSYAEIVKRNKIFFFQIPIDLKVLFYFHFIKINLNKLKNIQISSDKLLAITC